MANKYSNSSLVNYTRMSPCNSGTRTKPICRITPHCVVGQASVESLGEWFQNKDRQTAPNYGIGADGRVGLYVNESDRSWCTGGDRKVLGQSGSLNDQYAVTIECASDNTDPYAMRAVVYNKLVALCVDICQRNGKKKLLWLGSAEKAIFYDPKPDEMILTAHRWFSSYKSCPGPWLYSRFGDLADKVTKQLQGETKPTGALFRVQIGAFGSKKNAETYASQANRKGFPTVIKAEPVNGKTMYRVQCGAFASRQNAINFADRIKAAGFDAVIKEVQIA